MKRTKQFHINLNVRIFLNQFEYFKNEGMKSLLVCDFGIFKINSNFMLQENFVCCRILVLLLKRDLKWRL